MIDMLSRFSQRNAIAAINAYPSAWPRLSSAALCGVLPGNYLGDNSTKPQGKKTANAPISRFFSTLLEDFRDEMHQLGYSEGENYVAE